MKVIGGAKPRTIRAVASGSLTNGATVIVNTDGTVTAVAGSRDSVGSPVKFDDNYLATTETMSAAFDSTNNKVVLFYESGSSQYAVVGTVSGTSISFGTRVQVFNDGTVTRGVVFDENAGKFLFAYPGLNQTRLYLRVGTISGTSITLGTETSVFTTNAKRISMSYDPDINKTVISFIDGYGSDYPKAVVATISGTTPSIGSAYVIWSNDPTDVPMDQCYDTNANKHVIVYKKTSNGYANVLTANSSSEVSVGTQAQWGGSSNPQIENESNHFLVFDSSRNKVIVFFGDGGSSKLEAAVGTISSTSISFATKFEVRSGEVEGIGACFDSNQDKTIVFYNDVTSNKLFGIAVTMASDGSCTMSSELELIDGNGSVDAVTNVFDSNSNKVVGFSPTNLGGNRDGDAVVFTTGEGTNLTSENYIGIAGETVSDGAEATVQIKGAVDDAQSSLTPGQTYFVQIDGTLALTADDPSVIAGTAVTSTKLIVKG